MRPLIVKGALAAAALLVMLAPEMGRAATITRDFVDPAGRGFNDGTPVTPVGGNFGTSVGLQRRNVVNRALDIWGQRLQSTQTIRVQISFTTGDLPCTATTAAVGAAQADHHLIFRGTGGNPHPMTNVAYPAALYDRLTNLDAVPGSPDVLAVFNDRIGQSALPTW